jgi:spermidine synthase
VIWLVFFLSGFAALLYQLVWQRALFAIYGINIESVTMVVTAFMLGLGLGSLAGGALSKDSRRPVLVLFSLVEAGIGTFGLFSLGLFRAVGAATLDLSPTATAGVTFALVLVPTMLMGGTLPLLVAHEVRASGNVGRSVGMLYFVNTLGSALASLAAATFVMGSLGQAGTVRLAAGINFSIAAIIYVYSARLQKSATAAALASVRPATATVESDADSPAVASTETERA